MKWVRTGKTLQLRTDQGEKVIVPFTEKQEVDVITALKERNSVQLLVKGQGRRSPDGKLQEVREVTEEAWEDLPKDFSHRHDHYLYGTPRKP